MAKLGKLSGETFLQQLQSEGEAPAVFTGMVKPAEDDPKSLMFARPGDCAHWVKIPANTIAHVERLPAIGCGGHSHYMARLHFTPSEPEGKAFAALAQLHSAPAPVASQMASGFWDNNTGQWR
jgi:hypothetical protein